MRGEVTSSAAPLTISVSPRKKRIWMFATSFDELIVALFVAGGANSTLTRQMFLALRDQRDLYPFSMTGAELDAYVKKTVAEYRKIADEFGLIQK